MNVPGTQCLPGWEKGFAATNNVLLHRVQQHAACATVIYDMTGKPYSQACGRIDAYGMETQLALMRFT